MSERLVEIIVSKKLRKQLKLLKKDRTYEEYIWGLIRA